MKSFPRYYAVNDRPVTLETSLVGDIVVLVFDFKTREFVENSSYYTRIYEPGADVESLSEDEFSILVSTLRAET